ncbi:hypothetical protein [Enterococcus songbeiensis]|uniref:hypothetical protein n=1 Tax=Enterococcus songbeiensis TaxID=2559927 RepID=UPI0010F9AFA4|nr:hypothetical protein [Enterococcus songbeiensis]
MKYIRLFSMLIISIVGLMLGQMAYAANGMNSPSVTIVKRETASSSTVSQATKPVANVHYRLTRILPINGEKIVPTDSATYTIASKEQAFSIELITDTNGQTMYADTATLVEGYYLLEELAGSGNNKPATPIVFQLPYTDATGKVTDDFTYEPKSGLIDNNVSGSNHETIGQKNTTTIMQTSGDVWKISLTKALLGTSIFLSTVIGGTVLIRKRWEEKI